MREGYPAHPYAEIFPLHDGPSMWELRDDIKANGQQVAILLWTDERGKTWVADGRRRQACCLALDLEPNYRHFKGTEPELLWHVVSLNLKRRHLGEAERAMVAAKIENLARGVKKSNTPDGVSRADAASMLNVSGRAVCRAAAVQRDGCEGLQQAVVDGAVSLADAAGAAKKPKRKQRRALAKVKAGNAATMAEALAHEPEPVVDMEGRLVPPDLLEVFRDKSFEEAYQHLMAAQKAISEIATLPAGARLQQHLTRTQSGESIIWRMEEIERAKTHLRMTQPHSICPWCKGVKTKGCRCSGHGWITKPTWRDCPDAEKTRLSCN